MPSIFSRIISGEIPCYSIAETETCFAFLDISPLKKGHTLVVPKQEVDLLFDLEAMPYSELMLFTQQVAKAIHKAIPCLRVGLSVVGLEVAHAHIHLVPLDKISDLDFAKPKLQLSKEEFMEIAEKIRRNF